MKFTRLFRRQQVGEVCFVAGEKSPNIVGDQVDTHAPLHLENVTLALVSPG